MKLKHGFMYRNYKDKESGTDGTNSSYTLPINADRDVNPNNDDKNTTELNLLLFIVSYTYLCYFVVFVCLYFFSKNQAIYLFSSLRRQRLRCSRPTRSKRYSIH